MTNAKLDSSLTRRLLAIDGFLRNRNDVGLSTLRLQERVNAQAWLLPCNLGLNQLQYVFYIHSLLKNLALLSIYTAQHTTFVRRRFRSRDLDKLPILLRLCSR